MSPKDRPKHPNDAESDPKALRPNDAESDPKALQKGASDCHFATFVAMVRLYRNNTITNG